MTGFQNNKREIFNGLGANVKITLKNQQKYLKFKAQIRFKMFNRQLNPRNRLVAKKDNKVPS